MLSSLLLQKVCPPYRCVFATLVQKYLAYWDLKNFVVDNCKCISVKTCILPHSGLKYVSIVAGSGLMSKQLSNWYWSCSLTQICVTRPGSGNRLHSGALYLGEQIVIFNDLFHHHKTYHKISNIRRNKSSNLNDSRLVLQLSLSNLLTPGDESRMKSSMKRFDGSMPDSVITNTEH